MDPRAAHSVRGVTRGALGVLLIAALWAWGAAHAAPADAPKDGPVRVGISVDYPPYEYVDQSGVPQGFNVDALRAVAELRGLEIEFHPGLWSTVSERLRSGDIQVLPSVLRSEEREAWLAFSRPLLSVEYSIWVRKGSTSIASVADLRDQTVVVEADSLMHEFLKRLDTGAETFTVASEPEALRILDQGQFAAAIVPYRQGLSIAQKYALASIEPAGPPIYSASLCFAVRRGDDALLAQLDEGLAQLRESGGFQRIYNAHFGLAPAPDAPAAGKASDEDVLPWMIGAAGALIGIGLAGALIVAWRRSRPRRLGGYELVELIGAGGMGEVWLANHVKLSRPAAIKFVRMNALQGDAESSEHARVRFEREARATAALSSPNTIELYDFGETPDGALYYAMELLNGLDLQNLVELFGPVPPERAVHLLVQVCASLEEAHREGLLHRDIKPANIYACRMGTAYDVAKVLDFGLVKLRHPGHDKDTLPITRGDFVTGTPICIAPELIEGRPPADQRVDLYSLGCVAYWLLTGKTVFAAENAVAMAVAHATEAPMRPSVRAGIDVPPDLEALVMQCLEKAPADRPESADALAAALRACACAAAWTPAHAEKWWRDHVAAIEAARPGRSKGIIETA